METSKLNSIDDNNPAQAKDSLPLQPERSKEIQESGPQRPTRQPLYLSDKRKLHLKDLSFAHNEDFDLKLTPLVTKKGNLMGTAYSEIPDVTTPVTVMHADGQLMPSPTFTLASARVFKKDSKESIQSIQNSENGASLDYKVSSSHSCTPEQRVKLKAILEHVLNITRQRRTWINFQEQIEEKQVELEDQTPDFVEGIFFVKQSNWSNILRCRCPIQSSKICVYDARSFYLFDHQSRFRVLIVKFTESSEFQHLTLGIIMLTTLTLIIYNYGDPDSATKYNQLLDRINTYSSYYYFFEFMVQLITKGVFLHPNSYFRDGWNWLDFTVVFAGLTEMTNIPNLPIKGFRAFRVLRPLKSIRQFPRLRKLISGLLSSIPQLFNALVFMSFIFLLFSIFGSEQFGGVNYSRCRLPGDLVNGVWPIDLTQQSLCGKHQGGYACQANTICGTPLDVGQNYKTDDFQALSQSFNDYGISNFNNPLNSILTIFQCITLEGWSNIMFNMMNQQPGAVVIVFFCLVVVLGAFFLIHVILAVIGHSLQQNDLLETSELNIQKENLAISLKRREAQLQLNQRQSFIEQVRQNFQQQGQIADQSQSNQVSTKNGQDSVLIKDEQQNQGKDLVSGPVTERNLLTEVEPGREKQNTVQEVSTQRKQKSGRVVPEEEAFDSLSNEVQTPIVSNYPKRTHNNRLYLYFYKVCASSWFSIGMTLIIVTNSVVMALDRFPQPQNYDQVVGNLNQFFTWIFACEMIVKLVGLGLREYVRDSFNIFDAVIVIISVVDNLLQYTIGNSASGGGVTILRSVRLLRVFKLARNWKSLRILLSKIYETVPHIASFGFLLLIFQAVFIILGLQFFSGTVFLDKNDRLVDSKLGVPPLNNFENLYNASTTVFTIMMTDNWNQVMYQYYRKLGIQAQVYFVGTVVTLSIILLNLFLALFLENFENPTEKHEENDRDDVELTQFQDKLIGFVRKIIMKVPPRIEKRLSLLLKLQKLENLLAAKEEETDQEESDDLTMQKSLRKLNTIHELEKDVRKDWKLVEQQDKTDQRKRLLSIAQLVKNETVHEIIKYQKKKQVLATGTSLWLLSPDNWLRRFCLYVYNLAHFEDFSNFMVIFSTILLAIDNPLDDPHSRKQFVLTILDYITTSVFSFECFIKIVVYGLLFNGRQSYFRELWNLLDFFVVFVSVFSYLPVDFDMQFYKSMRLLRILRPLRMIQRNQGLKIAIKSLIKVLPGVMNLMMISGINLALLAVLGVNLFKGKFYTCNMTNVSARSQPSIRNIWDCQNYGGEWINADSNFDNFFNALSSVYQIMTTEGWFAISTSAQQSTEVFQMPSPMASPASFIYFVAVIFVQALFMTNLFIGAVIATFGAEKEKLTNNAQLTILEYEYLDVCTRCFQLKPIKVFSQKQFFRRICYVISDSTYFQSFVTVCIVVNTVLMSLTWYGQSKQIADRIEIFNIALSIIYTIEFLLKVTAFQFDYFKDGWNQLDFFIVICVVFGYVVKYALNSNYIVALAVIRVFRVARLLKLIRQLTLLKRCFQTFIDSSPEILNIGSLLILFLFMFVILGMNLFSGVKLQVYLNQNLNFQTFGTAFLTLFISCTGENWPLLMADLSRQRSIDFHCQDNQSFDDIQKMGIAGCGVQLGRIFFPIFSTFMAFVMLNLFSAVILEGFRREILDEQNKIRQTTLEMFQKLWKKYDPLATGMIAMEQLEFLILDFVDEEVRIQDKTPLKRQRASDEILFNFRHKKLLTLSAKWRKQEDDGSVEYFNLKKSEFFRKQLATYFFKFIGELQIPSYNKFEHFNFYDVLVSFVNFSFAQRQKYQHFQRKALIKRLRETNQELSKLDSIEPFSEDFNKLSKIEKQRLIELETENFINIIHRIEKKGKRPEITIQKLCFMQELRRRHIFRNKDMLDDLDGQVVSSRLLIAAKTISTFVARWKEKNRLRKLQAQLASASLVSQAKASERKSSSNIFGQGQQSSHRTTQVQRSSSSKVFQSAKSTVAKEQESTPRLVESDPISSSREKIQTDQPMDRIQVIDQNILDRLKEEAEGAKNQLEMNTRLEQKKDSNVSFGPFLAIKPKSIKLQAQSPEQSQVKSVDEQVVKKKVKKAPLRHKSTAFVLAGQLQLNFDQSITNQKLSRDLALGHRTLVPSIKESTLKIYSEQKAFKTMSQQQLHKQILKNLNHQPWRRFHREVAESDEEHPDDKAMSSGYHTKQPQRYQTRTTEIQAFVQSLRSRSGPAPARNYQPHISKQSSNNSESVSGSDSLENRYISSQSSPPVFAKKALLEDAHQDVKA